MKKILLGLSLCAATVLMANEDNYHWQFTPVIGGTSFDSDFRVKDEFFFGVRIAKNFEEGSFFDHLELGYDRVSGADLKSPLKGDADFDLYHLSLIKNFDVTDDFKFYGLVGGGWMDVNYKGKDTDGHSLGDYDTGFAQIGLGAKYYVADNFNLRLEARDVIGFKSETTHNFFYSLGFGIDFGKRTPDVVPVVVTPIGDEDGDGVADNIDRCPGTPAGVVVDEFGCEKVIRLDTKTLNFAFDSAEIKPEYKNAVVKVSDFLTENSGYKVIVEGHTDSTGDANYNQKLSERRAASVKNALVELGVSADRISTVGYGETQPIADNATREGRAENRRVDTKFRNQ